MESNVLDILLLRNPLRDRDIDSLIELLKEDDAKTRFQAAAALGEIEDTGKSLAIPALIQLLKDADPTIRFIAAQTLGQIGAHPLVVAPELLQLIATEKSHTIGSPSAAAFRALIKLGFLHPKDLIPTLLGAIEKNDRPMSVGLGDCLRKIGEKNQVLLNRYLMRALNSGNKAQEESAKLLQERIANATRKTAI